VTGTALITGASSGLGLELARLFARDGHDLVLTARHTDVLERLGGELAGRHGVRYWVIGADLADPGAPAAIVGRIPPAAVPVTVLVNNAGFGTSGPFAAIDLATEVALLQVNVVALTTLTKLLLPPMLAQRSGRILNVASTAAFQPGPFMAVYYASKAYVLSFSEALAEELDGSGVTVTALCPGPTATAFLARAGLTGVRLAERNPLTMQAAPVAAAGYRGLRRGARIVIPGVGNKLLALITQLSPRRVVVKVSRFILEWRGS
jgi:uncharacterized protein